MSGTDFFEFRESMVRARKGAASSTSPAKPGEPLSVTQLTHLIDRAIKSSVPSQVLVKGEVSNFKNHRGSGHLYFTLKDAKACIDCVMFRSDAERLKFTPEDGHELIASGRVGIYAERGRYQLYVSALHPVGRGALEIAFKQLYAKLETEGLFAHERKRPLPAYPQKIAIVTSRATAALQDLLKVLRRFPWLRLSVYHVSVQGDGSAEQIAAAIGQLSKSVRASKIELIILSRGGGSLEDLWEFNEEVVARAIVASSIPVITGIGHEIDTSIADLVADYHAHTPTEAAQIVTANWRTAENVIDAATRRFAQSARQLLTDARQQLRSIERHEVFRRPADRINQLRQMLDDRQRALTHALGRRIRAATSRFDRCSARLLARHPGHEVRLLQQRIGTMAVRLNATVAVSHERRRLHVAAMERQLEALSPEGVLRRGYSITRSKKTGAIVHAESQVKAGDRLMTRLAEGQIESTVDDPRQPKLFD